MENGDYISKVMESHQKNLAGSAVRCNENRISYIENESFKEEYKVWAGLKTLDFKVLKEDTYEGYAGSLSSKYIGSIDYK